jgi:hypothetical protein
MLFNLFFYKKINYCRDRSKTTLVINPRINRLLRQIIGWLGNYKPTWSVGKNNLCFIKMSTFNVKKSYALAAGNNIAEKVRNVVAAGLGSGGNLIIGNAGHGAETTGQNNVAVGLQAGDGLTTGASNAFLGSDSGAGVTTGDFNTFVGRLAGNDVTTADNNTGVGYLTCGAADVALTGNQNVCVGNAAGENLQGASANNTFVGSSAGNAATVRSGALVLGSGAVVSADNELVLGSATVPLRTTGASGVVTGYLRITVNGRAQLLELYAEP